MLDDAGARRLLLIDDDAELCRLLRTCLKAEGFDAEAVHDGVWKK